jgi:hypothetical protein
MTEPANGKFMHNKGELIALEDRHFAIARAKREHAELIEGLMREFPEIYEWNTDAPRSEE